MKYFSTAIVFVAAVWGSVKIYESGQAWSGTRGSLLVLIGVAVCMAIIGHGAKKG